MPARPFHGPDAARPVAGAKDPSRADARFNGRPGWFIDPGHVVPAGAAVVAATTAARSSFFPGRRSVRAGESVRFEMSARSTELHNVVFGPEDVPERTAAAFITIAPQGIAYDPLSVYPSAPGALAHDGGFLNTGLIDADPRSSFQRAKSVRFTAPAATASSARSTGRR